MANAQLRRGDKVTSLQVVKSEKQKISESAQRNSLANLFHEMQQMAARGDLTGIFFCLDLRGHQRAGRAGTFRKDLGAGALAIIRMQRGFLSELKESEERNG